MERGDGDEEEEGRSVPLVPPPERRAICCQPFAFTPWAELNNKIFIAQILLHPPPQPRSGTTEARLPGNRRRGYFRFSELTSDERRRRGNAAANPAALKPDAPAGSIKWARWNGNASVPPPLEEADGGNLLIPRYLSHLLNLLPGGVAVH